MKNNLIKDNAKQISKLSIVDKQLVIDYFNTWSETTPCYFNDGNTIKDTFDIYFAEWIKNNPNLFVPLLQMEEIKNEIVDYVENDMTLIEYYEYDVDVIVGVYNNDDKVCQSLCNEMLENYNNNK